ncbi:MAG: hypothetical protein HYS26_00045 [Candidatus Kaiserbacteria bacterium]|nr:MAG: hypothetical protein HYS26_00045 [Candidatus Kaiserbacteria bacterium]
MTNQTKYGLIGLGVLVIIVAIFVATQTGLFSGGSGQGGVASSTAPSLTEGVAFDQNIPADLRDQLSQLIADDREALSQNYDQYELWLRLAIRYKQAGDYQKAREVWEYLAYNYPDDVVSRHNLGDLYQHFTVDYVKAEQYYLAALEADMIDGVGSAGVTYLALHELYRYDYKQNTSAAADILKQGIERIAGPQAIDLNAALARYYESKGQKAEAAAAYRAAAAGAREVNNTSLAAQFEASAAALE